VSAREAIAQAGGLVTLGGMARRWGVSSARAAVYAGGKGRPDRWEPFPAPVEVAGMTTRVWLWDEVEDWHARNVVLPHKAKQGR